jgi:glycosyltransferase involved in cell wall biosynthesis
LSKTGSSKTGSETADHVGKAVYVSIVMPCLNEEEAVGQCVDIAHQGLRQCGVRGEVVVADNGSSDRSVEIAREHGARVVHEPRRGYGAALRAAIEAARGEVIIMGDSDGSHDWREIGRFLDKLDEGYGLVMGNRFQGDVKPGAMPRLNRYLGNPFFSRLSAYFYKIPIGDFHCGMRAFHKKDYDTMKLSTSGMEFATEMVVKAANAGLSITEVPITVHAPTRSRRPHLRPFRDGWRHLRFIMTYAPNYLYLVPGGVLMAAGVFLQAMLIGGPVEIGGLYLGIHFLALGCLLTLVGAHVLWFGVLAKVIVAARDSMWQNRTATWLKKRFTLETGLLAGGLLVLAGVVVDSILAWRWVSATGSMEDSVHVVFVATTAIAVGIQVMFFAFLLHLALAEK